MSGTMIGREPEALEIDALLNSASDGPCALIVDGEAGIGKTTVWNEAIRRAADRGFTVLASQASQAESVLSYTTLADLLGGIDRNQFFDLPAPQKDAVLQILLRSDHAGALTDRQALAAGFLSAVERVARESPVLVAIDDLQWMDASSLQAIAFAVRRVRGSVAVFASLRAETERDGLVALQLRSPESMRRHRLKPLDQNALHKLILDRLDVALPRPLTARIHRISGGNPFYALELARAVGDDPAPVGDLALPTTLAELVEARIGGLEPKVRHVLLGVACAAEPTVELVAHAADTDVSSALRLIEEAESVGVVDIVGEAVRFAHPLLAHGVYTQAGAARRRAMHQRLAGILREPELRARHLALAATTADSETLQALDKSAETAFAKAAPASAAELVELAIGLGGPTDERLIRAAAYHDAAGDPKRARTILEDCIKRIEPGPLRAQALAQLAMVRLLSDDMFAATELLDQAYGEAEGNLSLRVTVAVTAVLALYHAADATGALNWAERAVSDATPLGDPGLLAQALGFRTIMRFLWGEGIDWVELDRALELESKAPEIPIPLRPSMHHAQLLNWSGDFDRAIDEMEAIRRICVDRGHESDMLLIAVQMFIAELWRGNLPAAEAIARENTDRARMLDGEIPRCTELAMRCTLAAHTGRIDEARASGHEVIAASVRCGMEGLAIGSMAAVATVEIALGNHQAALDVVAPILFKPGWPSGTELIASWCMPDGIEALIQLGRYDDASSLIGQLERNGTRVDRPWTLAMGARYRGMLHAAQGDFGSAVESAQLAMTQHDRMTMPFEKARTQLLLGQLQRRQRRRVSAAETLRDAVSVFEQLGAPLWADRARDELARAEVGRRVSDVLSPSEQRVAELAGSGMTIREVAAALFISPKTVDANIVRIYRKLGIHSRAELGRYVRGAET
jgi:DNA-binding CsgD family transcriptional regulator